MISHQQAEEIAARYRAMGFRLCDAIDVMRFFGPTAEDQVASLNELRLRFGVTRAELEDRHA